jgi:hypothetical protein
MPRRRHALHALGLAALALALGACGGGDQPQASGLAQPDFRLITPPKYKGADAISVPTPHADPTMHASDVRRLRPVLDGWSRAVRAGHAAAAAHYFALPTIVAQPTTGPIEIRTKAIATRFNDSFPCGAKLVSARPDGRYILGTFMLVSVPGRTCTTPKALVKVGFVFGDRKHPRQFTEWWRVADTPGSVTGPAERPAAPIAKSDSFG